MCKTHLPREAFDPKKLETLVSKANSNNRAECIKHQAFFAQPERQDRPHRGHDTDPHRRLPPLRRPPWPPPVSRALRAEHHERALLWSRCVCTRRPARAPSTLVQAHDLRHTRLHACTRKFTPHISLRGQHHYTLIKTDLHTRTYTRTHTHTSNFSPAPPRRACYCTLYCITYCWSRSLNSADSVRCDHE